MMNEKKFKNLLKNTKVILLDLDGTLYLDKVPFKGVDSTLKELRKRGIKLVYLTNNSSRTKEVYENLLKEIKLFKRGDTVYTSTQATIDFVKNYNKDAKVYLVATDDVKKEFVKEKINLIEEYPDICVLTYDTTINFEKFKKLNEFVVKGAFYIASHPDDVCPMPDVYMPDVGSFIKLIECSSGRTPDVICGKPFSYMGEGIKNTFLVNSDEIIMIGDRLHTDVRFANNNGFTSVLVLSGETDESMLKRSKDKPDFVLKDVNDILNYLD